MGLYKNQRNKTDLVVEESKSPKDHLKKLSMKVKTSSERLEETKIIDMSSQLDNPTNQSHKKSRADILVAQESDMNGKNCFINQSHDEINIGAE